MFSIGNHQGNVDQSHSGTPLHTCEDSCHQKDRSLSEGVEEGKSCVPFESVETYGRHVPPQGSAARFRSPDEAVSVFPGLESALTAVGAPLGVPGRPLAPCTEKNEERRGGGHS
ncbi:unnamed protein product [Rangifer tarandus platyrhynchus]|uniref:Uncharacterized protein n=1 Tax=Rangifer tarandus platyrhynchus TaxID=3082113 RepID=A0ACB1MJN5_RANTA